MRHSQLLGHSTRMTDSRESRAAKIQDSIRQVFRHDWNPIGFGDVLPEDEYDSYIAPVYRILAGSRSEQEIIECLFRLESDIANRFQYFAPICPLCYILEFALC